ncbi:MAG: BatA domain-containing protein [Planctomycetaceae bacterium]|nr:BatA domain-containing protein [Planctomycetaceae bacterium]
MSFITFSLLIGGAAVSVLPVILHILMRGKPRQIEFPALMFIKRQIEIRRRSFMLKHMLLLLLRIALFVLLGLALARPLLTTGGENKLFSSIASKEVPVSAALVIDNSFRMQYHTENKTLLDVARQFALNILKQLPKDSEIAVVTGERIPSGFQVDSIAAENQIHNIKTLYDIRSAAESASEAIRILSAGKERKRELYILTDFSEPAWNSYSSDLLSNAVDALKKSADTGIFVIDAGVPQPVNTAVVSLALSSQTATESLPVSLDITVSHLGSAASQTLELILFKQDADGKPIEEVRNTRILQFQDGESRNQVSFQLTALNEGTHQGLVRLTAPDALTEDNQYTFTVQVLPKQNVLVISHPPVEKTAVFLQQALEASDFIADTLNYTEGTALKLNELQKYAAVFLLDPPKSSASFWRQLGDYVNSGGGLGIIAGQQSDAASLNDDFVKKLTGAEIIRQARRPDGSLFLMPKEGAEQQTAVLHPFNQIRNLPWKEQKVFRYWEIGELLPTAEVAMLYSDGRPAMLTQNIVRGRTLFLTTPLSYIPDETKHWNVLPNNDAAWMFILLTEGIVKFLCGSSELNYNYFVGENVRLSPKAAERKFPETCMLQMPDGKSHALATDTQNREIRISSVSLPGNYRILSGGEKKIIDLGFSTGLPERELNIKRIQPEVLDKFFGKGNYRICKSAEEIEQGITRQRQGAELYPFVLLLVLLFFAAEYVFANRFYS